MSLFLVHNDAVTLPDETGVELCVVILPRPSLVPEVALFYVLSRPPDPEHVPAK